METENIIENVNKGDIIDGQAVAKVFEKIKNKGILDKPIEMNLKTDKTQNLSKMQVNDYIDQFVYYRNLRGYFQEEIGRVIGVSGKYYYKYESRTCKLEDLEKIKKIADF